MRNEFIRKSPSRTLCIIHRRYTVLTLERVQCLLGFFLNSDAQLYRLVRFFVRSVHLRQEILPGLLLFLALSQRHLRLLQLFGHFHQKVYEVIVAFLIRQIVFDLLSLRASA